MLAIRGSGDPALTSEQYWRLAADLRLARGSQGSKWAAARRERVRRRTLASELGADFSAGLPRARRRAVRELQRLFRHCGSGVEAGRTRAGPGWTPGPPTFDSTTAQRPAIAKRATSLVVDRVRSGRSEEVVVSGVVRAAGESKVYHRSVLDPVRYAGSVMRAQLEANGIAVEGEVRLGVVPDSMVSLLEFEGKSLADVVQLFLKYSNNTMGEMLVKALGVHDAGVGSWSTGIAAVREQLERLGIDVAGLSIVDGSGLSYQNRVTPRTLVSALRVAKDSFGFGPEFVAALPIAAADGTLEKRTGDAADRVRAKTGLLTRITSLSGYAMSADGQPLVFSVLVNGFSGSDEAAMDAVDHFASELTKSRISGAPDRDQGAR